MALGEIDIGEGQRLEHVDRVCEALAGLGQRPLEVRQGGGVYMDDQVIKIGKALVDGAQSTACIIGHIAGAQGIKTLA